MAGHVYPAIFTAGLQGELDVVDRSYDLFSPGYAVDLSIAVDGIQITLDEDTRSGMVDKMFTLDRVVNDRILEQGSGSCENKVD